jgi:uncharacterized secreted protein with C-terminal beta-propeller domain
MMVSRRTVMVVMAVAALSAAAVEGAAIAAPGASAKAGRLVAFKSCPELLSYAKTHATRYVGPYGFGGQIALSASKGMPAPSAAGAATDAMASREASSPQLGVDYSGTNVQETGVDEPDTVKTNGKTLFAVANGLLNAVDVTGGKPQLLDTLKLDGGWSHELLLHGDRLLILSRGGYWIEPMPAMARGMMPINPSNSVIIEVDVSNPKALKTIKKLTLEGSYVDARMVGSVVRIVSSSQMPVELPFAKPAASTGPALTAAKTKNITVLKSSGVKAWLPSYKLGLKKERSLVQCRDVRRPVEFSGLGLLTVLTIDLSKGLAPVDSVAVMTDGRIVYASQSSLFVTTESWADRPDPNTPTVAPSSVTTTIHRFDISNPIKTVYRGSGSVQGYLLNQWAMSDFQGVLRVVSTEAPAWWGTTDETQSFLTTLRQNDDGLVQVGRVGGLGRGERVYAVRYVGNAGYVVTFKQIDPLYTLDLSDPAKPRVVGELKIPGYSAYLHPINEDLLLGIGQDVDPVTNRSNGTQISLFDVSDLKNPTRLHQAPLGQGWSEAESQHHAFLYWPPTGLVVVPFGQQAVGMKVSRAGGINEIGARILHTEANQAYLPEIHRSVVVGSSLLTISDLGIKASALSSLASLGWAAFPIPAPTPVPDAVASKPAVVPGR